MEKLMKIVHNKKGSSLVVVVVIFAVVAILGTTLITVVSSSFDSSIYYHRQQQADLTAQSVIRTVAQTLGDETICGTFTTPLMANPGKIYTGAVKVGDGTTNMGKATVSMVYSAATKKIQVDVVAEYQGSSARITETMAESDDGTIDPLDFSLFGTANAFTPTGTADNPILIDGDVMARGATILTETTVYGNLLNVGGFQMKDNSWVGNDPLKPGKPKKLIINNGASAGGDISFGATSTLNAKLYMTKAYGEWAFLDPSFEFVVPAVPANCNIGTNKLGTGATVQIDPRDVSGSYVTQCAGGIIFPDGELYTDGLKRATLPDGTVLDLWNNRYAPANSQADLDEADASGVVIGSEPKADQWVAKTGLLTGLINDVSANFGTHIMYFKDGNYITTDGNWGTLHFAGSSSTVNLSTGKYTEGTTSTTYDLADVVVKKDGTCIVKPTPSALAGGDNTTPTVVNDNISVNNNTVSGTVIFDTTAKDIEVYAPDGLTFGAGSEILVKGNHFVNIYIGTGKTIRIGDGAKVGLKATCNGSGALTSIEGAINTDTARTQMCFWGGVNTHTIVESDHLGDPTTLKAIVYLNGNGTKFDDGGDNLIYGSAMAASLNVGEGTEYHHIKPIRQPSSNTTLLTDRHYIYPPRNASNIAFDHDHWGKDV